MPEEWLIIISENEKLKRMANNSLKRGSVYNKMAELASSLFSQMSSLRTSTPPSGHDENWNLYKLGSPPCHNP